MRHLLCILFALSLVGDCRAGQIFRGSTAGGGGPSITHVGNWSTTTPSDSITINVSGIQANDFVILYAVNDSSSGPGITWPSGFTEISEASTSFDSGSIAVATKLAAGSETSFTMGTLGTYFIAGCSVFRGVNTTTPLDVTSVVYTDNSGSSSPFSVASTIVPTTANSMLVGVVHWDVNAGVGAISNSYSGGSLSWTAYGVDESGGGYRHMALGYANQPSATSTTVTATGTVSGADAAKVIFLLALRP